MIGKMKNPYKELEKNIGYSFKKRKLLERALTHRSYRFENDDVDTDNQRMEFLGDAILGFGVAASLFMRYPESDEGELTSFRSQTTSGKALAEVANKIELGKYLKVGKGEENSGGRERSSNLEDALESVIGAVYLDGGMKAVQKLFKKVFDPSLDDLSGDVWADNPKGELQECTQKKWKVSPRYRVVKKDGPPHNMVFTVEVIVNDDVKGIGEGKNKQEAETEAAIEALMALKYK